MLKIDFFLFLAIVFGLGSIQGEASSDPTFESAVCRLLSNNMVALSPWTSYPIIFEPVTRGRIIVWTGVTTIPTSEFRCFSPQGSNHSILIEFSDFANKLEWSFEDVNKGTTYFGNTISHVDGVHYKMNINDEQMASYLQCNKVASVELVNPNKAIGKLITSCSDCTPQVVPLVEAQLKELIKNKFNDQIKNKLFWDVNQLVYSHHFDHPISVHNDLN